MIYLLFALTATVLLCGMLCTIELLTDLWERMEQRGGTAHHRTRTRNAEYAARAHERSARQQSVGALPDREEIGNVYSMSDNFADRFCEVWNS